MRGLGSVDLLSVGDHFVEARHFFCWAAEEEAALGCGGRLLIADNGVDISRDEKHFFDKVVVAVDREPLVDKLFGHRLDKSRNVLVTKLLLIF